MIKRRHAVTVVAQALVAATLLPARPAAAQEIIELPAEDRRLEADLEDVYRVGTMTGEDWEQFGNVRRVGFDAEGKLCVFDNQADRIHVVGRVGQYLRTLGRSGEGPGKSSNCASRPGRKRTATGHQPPVVVPTTHGMA